MARLLSPIFTRGAVASALALLLVIGASFLIAVQVVQAFRLAAMIARKPVSMYSATSRAGVLAPLVGMFFFQFPFYLFNSPP